MTRRSSCVAVAALGATLALATAPAALAQACVSDPMDCNDGVRCTQRVDLAPGWNAVYLEVQPDPNDIEAVFQGIPVESVWAWNPRHSPVDFISDPSEGVLQETGWLGFRPRTRPEAFLTNLFRVTVNQPYLVKLGGSQPVCWQASGRPSLRRGRWVPNSFNLVGMGIDPDVPVTFDQFFAASPAHAGQPVYRLVPGENTWKLAGCADPAACAGSTMRSGEAFWIYTDGASDYSGPMHVELEQGDGLDFGQSIEELELLVTNRSSQPQSYTVRDVTELANEPVNLYPVSYRKFVNTELSPAELGFPDLAHPDPDSVPDSVLTIPDELTEPSAGPARPGQVVRLRLSPRRFFFPDDRVESVLEVSDNAGCRRLVPMSAEVLGAAPTSGSPAALRARTRSHDGSLTPFHGLWVGTVTLDKVAEVHGDFPDRIGVEEKTGSTFSFRLIVHVDDSGQASLLKEVVQMWRDGSGPDDPGSHVLVTCDDGLLEFKGSALRDGELVGRRISTAAYDFDQSSGAGLALVGGFRTNGMLATTFSLAAASPTNPFFHRFHDQHDGEGEAGEDPAREVYSITRTMKLVLHGNDPLADPDGRLRPAWGQTLMTGTYTEDLTGLHRSELHTAGTFELRRITDTGVLSVCPTPGS